MLTRELTEVERGALRGVPRKSKAGMTEREMYLHVRIAALERRVEELEKRTDPHRMAGYD